MVYTFLDSTKLCCLPCFSYLSYDCWKSQASVFIMVIVLLLKNFAIVAGNIFDVKMNIDGQTITASRYKGVLTFSENYVIVLQTLLLVHNGLHTNELSKRD